MKLCSPRVFVKFAVIRGRRTLCVQSTTPQEQRLTPSLSEHQAGASRDAWIGQLTSHLAQLSPLERDDWNSIKAAIGECETELFEPEEQFADGSLLADSWYTLLVQQLKVSRSIRLSHDDLCAIRSLLRQYRANDPSTLERVHQLTYRAEDLFHSRQLVQSECVMRLFRPPKAVRQANQRQLITTRAIELLTQNHAIKAAGSAQSDSASPVSASSKLAGRIDEISKSFGVTLVLTQDLFGNEPTDVDSKIFPSVVRTIPGLSHPFSGVLRPIERKLRDEILLSRIRRASGEYTRHDHFRDVLYTFYSATMTTLGTRIDRQLPAYFRWLQAQLDEPDATLISDLHARAAYGGESFVTIVREAAARIEYATHSAIADHADDELLALANTMLSDIDWSSLALGEYDIVRLIAEYDSDVPHDEPETCAMLARLI